MNKSNIRKFIIIDFFITLGVLFYIFFIFSPNPNKNKFIIDIPKLRSITENQDRPIDIRKIVIGKGEFPEGAVISNGNLISKLPLVFVAYKINYPNYYIYIDSTHTEKIHKELFKDQPYNKENFKKLSNELLDANMILFTHEHPDHIGGVFDSPNFEKIKNKIFLTTEQQNGNIDEKLFSRNVVKNLLIKPIEDYYSPSGGIVLIKSPGHSKGSQIIYVRLKNDQEYLFIGDIAWNEKNIKEIKGRPLLISWLFLNENREKVSNQLYELNQIHKEYPDIHIIISHDVNSNEYISNL
jgi:hypothetical protein